MSPTPKSIVVIAEPGGWHYRDLCRAAADLGGLRLSALPFRELSARVGAAESGHGLGADALLVRAMPSGSLEQIVFRMDALWAIHQTGLPVINPPKAIEASVDKYLALVRLQRAGICVPRTCVSQSVHHARIHFEQLGGDVVVKPIFGSLGNGVARIQSASAANDYFRQCEHQQRVIYQQEFIDHGGVDFRLLYRGGEIMGMRRHARGSWVTNLSRGGIGSHHAATAAEGKLARAACHAVGVQFGGVDVAYDRRSGQPFVLEVNSAPGWRYLSRICDRDVAGWLLNWLTTVAIAG